MRRILITALAATTAMGLAISTPAFADIISVDASSDQGTLVHGVGEAQTGTDVVANLGAGGPNIVHFTGDTTQTTSTSDVLMLQQGQGQADVTGAEISGNSTYPLNSGDIFLTGHTGMTFIELALMGTANTTVNFSLTDNNGDVTPFALLLGSGDTHFAFQAINGQSITNLHFDASPGTIDIIKQVRITAVPEPATWGMMLLGFAGIGMAIRRSRRRSHALMQIA